MIEIKQFKEDTKGRFSALDGDKIAGSIYYTLVGETKMILDHTEVDNAYRGQSIGKKILWANVGLVILHSGHNS